MGQVVVAVVVVVPRYGTKTYKQNKQDETQQKCPWTDQLMDNGKQQQDFIRMQICW